MLGRVGSSVGRIGIISANSGPNFSYTGTNAAFQSALTEAAYTGLVAGFSAPAYPQYWLRGVSYPSFLSMPGATYTRTGNRAGLDAAVVYSANVPRVAPSSGLRVFRAGTNEARVSEDFSVGVWGNSFISVTPNAIIAPDGTLTADRITGSGGAPRTAQAQQQIAIGGGTASKAFTVSCWLRAVSGTTSLSLKNTQSGVLDNFQDFTLTTTWARYSFTVTNGGSLGTGEQGFGIASDALGSAFDLYAWGFQTEQSSFASDYIPNPNTGASSSAGADDARVSFTVPTECTIIAEWIEPPVYNSSRVIGTTAAGGNTPIFSGSPTLISAWNGVTQLNGATATRAAGSIQRAVYRQTAAGRQLHYNGAQIAADALFDASITALIIGSGGSLANQLNSGLRVVSVTPRDIGATQANAVSVL